MPIKVVRHYNERSNQPRHANNIGNFTNPLLTVLTRAQSRPIIIKSFKNDESTAGQAIQNIADELLPDLFPYTIASARVDEARGGLYYVQVLPDKDTLERTRAETEQILGAFGVTFFEDRAHDGDSTFGCYDDFQKARKAAKLIIENAPNMMPLQFHEPRVLIQKSS